MPLVGGAGVGVQAHEQYDVQRASRAHLGRVERIERDEGEGKFTTRAEGLAVHRWVLEPTHEPLLDAFNQLHGRLLGREKAKG